MAPDASPDVAVSRLAALRREISRRGLAGFLVPRADEHQGEYVPPSAARLAWLTGFDGSAGLAIALGDRAALFVDGRYTLQAVDQVDGSLYEILHIVRTPPATWLAVALPQGGKVGYDPWLHTPEAVERLAADCRLAAIELFAVEENPLDVVWTDRPPPSTAPFFAHPERYAGKASAEKRAEIAAALVSAGADAAVLTLPDSIAWLLNIRGADVSRAPFPLSFAIAHATGRVTLFASPAKVPPDLRDHLGEEVSVEEPDRFGPALDALSGAAVRLDPSSAAVWILHRLEAAGAVVQRGEDPCQLPKACKNPVELEGARAAHRRDGAAVTRFLAWLANTAPSGGVTELSAANRLEAFRREDPLLRDLSFDTISGAGANGAIVHYRVTPRTDRPLRTGDLYLVDSGGQYPDGTTDVTRTVAIGQPSDTMRRHYTLVLKGHIALATARFPEGTTGSQLDCLARAPLWREGLDYDHGTGHGVGSYLSVHEGPQRISKLPNRTALRPGMILSNEPGYYLAGAYGIRIENLVAVAEVTGEPGGVVEGGPTMLGFETLTLAPFDRALIDRQLLTDEEAAWVDAYHGRVVAEIGPLVDERTRVWLEEAVRPL